MPDGLNLNGKLARRREPIGAGSARTRMILIRPATLTADTGIRIRLTRSTISLAPAIPMGKAGGLKGNEGMTTPDPDSPWNPAAKISCEFSFKCPKQWDRLQPTVVEGVRHCSECDRDVLLR